MSAKLLALDVGAGDALIYSEGQWYLASLDHGWRPLNVEGHEGAVAWGLSAWALPVDREYEDLYAAILEARSVCLAASARGVSYSASPDLLQELFEESQARQAKRRGRDKEFENVIRQFTGRLDRFFGSRGCSPDESLELILETFEALYEAGPLEESHLARRVFELALETCRRPQGSGGEESPSRDPAGQRIGQGERPIPEIREKAAWRGLSVQDLRILYFWTLRRYGPREIGILLNLSEDEVAADLRRMTERLGRPLEGLQQAELTALCLQELRRRGEKP
jgi:DNA-directed RNA polymerase specialized sigma24 family protein